MRKGCGGVHLPAIHTPNSIPAYRPPEGSGEPKLDAVVRVLCLSAGPRLARTTFSYQEATHGEAGNGPGIRVLKEVRRNSLADGARLRNPTSTAATCQPLSSVPASICLQTFNTSRNAIQAAPFPSLRRLSSPLPPLLGRLNLDACSRARRAICTR